MLGIQIAIGALNDHVDRHRDAVEKPGKPIPAGLATGRQALALTVAAGGAGLALSAVSGLPTLLAIGFALAMGVTYDLRLSRTAWSWLPLALALPVVPIHAWLGATGSVPPGLLGLVPTGVLAGAMLAIANGLVDVERDARSNRPGVVVALGVRLGWLVHAVLLATGVALALGLARDVPSGGGSGGGESPGPTVLPIELLRSLRTWGMVVGVAALAFGAVALRAASPAIRERGWELEAVGVAGVGLGWLAGTAAGSGGGL